MDITIEFFMKNYPIQTYYQPHTTKNGRVHVRVSAYQQTLRLEDSMTKTLAKFIPSPVLLLFPLFLTAVALAKDAKSIQKPVTRDFVKVNPITQVIRAAVGRFGR